MKAADTAPPPNMLNSRPDERTMSVPVCLSVPFTVYLGEPKEDAHCWREAQAIILFQWARDVPASS